MSVTAHRITEFKFEDWSFDLWHDEKFVQFLEKEVRLSSNLDLYGTGLLEIPLETLERAVVMADELDLDEDTVMALNTDIATARSARKEFVTYYCC